MQKYVIEVLEGQKLTAGSKAKEDIVRFLLNDNFNKITINGPKSKLAKLMLGKRYWKRILKNIEHNSTVVYQYPAYSRIMGDYFILEARRKKLFTIMVIHDLDSFRAYKNNVKDISRELQFLNQFDVVICHNETMKSWLETSGCHVPLVSLEIFDYYETASIKEIGTDQSIVFAGNLAKSDFISKLACSTPVNLFGVNPQNEYPKNIIYKGAFDPSELANHLIGKYGLVWDGDSIESCTGITGEYMKINNPHKTSLYLTLGIPIIIWREAALAKFIEENQLGIVLDSLSDLDKVLQEIPDDQYLKYKSNSVEMSKKLRDGWFIKESIRKSMKYQ